jgi:uncharacterized protein (DUF3084 family)
MRCAINRGIMKKNIIIIVGVGTLFLSIIILTFILKVNNLNSKLKQSKELLVKAEEERMRLEREREKLNKEKEKLQVDAVSN